MEPREVTALSLDITTSALTDSDADQRMTRLCPTEASRRPARMGRNRLLLPHPHLPTLQNSVPPRWPCSDPVASALGADKQPVTSSRVRHSLPRGLVTERAPRRALRCSRRHSCGWACDCRVVRGTTEAPPLPSPTRLLLTQRFRKPQTPRRDSSELVQPVIAPERVCSVSQYLRRDPTPL